MSYAIFHDWYDQASHDKRPACHTGEFIFIGTLDECAEHMKLASRSHPKWRLSIHALG
jgi:hypothetical protein